MTPTAKEFLKNFHRQEEHNLEQGVQEAMIEFSKLHVEAALKAAVRNAEITTIGRYTKTQLIDEDSILDSYPLTNIK